MPCWLIRTLPVFSTSEHHTTVRPEPGSSACNTCEHQYTVCQFGHHGQLVTSNNNGCYSFIKLRLTNDQRFFEFDIVAEYTSDLLLEMDGGEECHPEISAHSKGTGKTFGYLALQLLAEHGKNQQLQACRCNANLSVL